MSEFPIIATLVSTFLAGGLGALWYGPLCGNAWLAAGGKTKEEIDDGAKPIMIAMLTWLVSAIVFSLLTSSYGVSGFGSLIRFAVLAWLGFGLVPTVLSVVFQEKSRAFLWIDGGYHLCGWLLMAVAHSVLEQVL